MTDINTLKRRANSIKGVSDVKSVKLPFDIHLPTEREFMTNKDLPTISFMFKGKNLGAISGDKSVTVIVRRRDGIRWAFPGRWTKILANLNNEINIKDVKDVEKITKQIKKTATKLPKKTLKLEGTQMKYTSLINLLKKAILYKRKRKMVEDIYRRISEEEKIVVPRKHDVKTADDKRKKLKDIYKKMLKGTPYAENIPAFMELIDQADESYLDYELQINFNDAFKTVDELISGKGDLTQDEMAELANIVSGIGIPAIEKHATGKHKLDPKSAKFGAEELSKSSKRFNQSIEQRRKTKGLPAPESKEVVTTTQSKELAPARKALQKMFTAVDIPKDSPFWKTASKLKSKGINVERLAKSMVGANKYSDAKARAAKELNKQGKGIEDLRGTDDMFNLWNQIKKQKTREKVRIKR